MKIILFLVSFFSIVSIASAHVTVKPAEVGVGQRLNFVVSVPTEEDTPTTRVRLIIPEGVDSVRPNVKPGWSIELKREDDRVVEILWFGGRIPAEQRDEFIFSAQAPAEERTLVWKAYQTYGNGTVVAWEADPGAEPEPETPWSETKVIDDLAPVQEVNFWERNKSNIASALSTLALIVSLAAIRRNGR